MLFALTSRRQRNCLETPWSVISAPGLLSTRNIVNTLLHLPPPSPSYLSSFSHTRCLPLSIPQSIYFLALFLSLSLSLGTGRGSRYLAHAPRYVSSFVDGRKFGKVLLVSPRRGAKNQRVVARWIAFNPRELSSRLPTRGGQVVSNRIMVGPELFSREDGIISFFVEFEGRSFKLSYPGTIIERFLIFFFFFHRNHRIIKLSGERIFRKDRLCPKSTLFSEKLKAAQKL